MAYTTRAMRDRAKAEHAEERHPSKARHRILRREAGELAAEDGHDRYPDVSVEFLKDHYREVTAYEHERELFHRERLGVSDAQILAEHDRESAYTAEELRAAWKRENEWLARRKLEGNS